MQNNTQHVEGNSRLPFLIIQGQVRWLTYKFFLKSKRNQIFLHKENLPCGTDKGLVGFQKD